MGVQNGTFAPEIPNDEGAEIPPDLVAAGAESAHVYGRVFADVAQVRITTNQGDVFETETLRPDDPGPRYFVIVIPAAKAPLEMEVEHVEYAVLTRSADDRPEWPAEVHYLMRHA